MRKSRLIPNASSSVPVRTAAEGDRVQRLPCRVIDSASAFGWLLLCIRGRILSSPGPCTACIPALVHLIRHPWRIIPEMIIPNAKKPPHSERSVICPCTDSRGKRSGSAAAVQGRCIRFPFCGCIAGKADHVSGSGTLSSRRCLTSRLPYRRQPYASLASAAKRDGAGACPGADTCRPMPAYHSLFSYG